MFTNRAERGAERDGENGNVSNRERPLRTDGGSTAAADGMNRERSTRQGDDEGRGATDRRLEERLRAVERALTGGDRSVADLQSSAAADEERDRFDERLGDLETRIEELEAATQAIRGYVGAVRAVNREVERRADLALATATEARAATDEPRGETTETTERDPLDDPAITAAVPEAPPANEDRVMGEGRGDDRSMGAATLERLREVI